MARLTLGRANMNRQILKDGLGWGVVLWLIGYALGIVLFALVPARFIGWIITPIGTAITVWVAFKKVNGNSLPYFGRVALAWLLIAVVGDYVFIVKAFKPADGYYKADVYLYYVLTLIIPLWAGWIRAVRRQAERREGSAL
jgi:hypothetical protein